MTHTPKLNDELGKQISTVANLAHKDNKAKAKLLDLFVASGFANTDLISPTSEGSTASAETFNWVKGCIFAGFPKGVQDLLELSAKAAGDKLVDGQNRAYWKRQPNSIIGNMQTSLRKREEIDAEIASGKQGADARTRSKEAVVREALEDCVKRIQKAETFQSDMELDDMLAMLNALIKAIG
jgi:predicted transcriptional regulator